MSEVTSIQKLQAGSLARSAGKTSRRETVAEKMARYKELSRAMTHEQRGTDEQVNSDAEKHYKAWADLRKQADDIE